MLATAVVCLAGCAQANQSKSAVPQVSQTESAPATEAPSPTQAPSATPYLDVPVGVELTEPGTELGFGDRATVAWKLPKRAGKGKGAQRKRKVGAVTIKVVRAEKASLDLFTGWDLNEAARDSNPFLVRAKVKNVGKTNLGGLQMPFFVADDRNFLIQPSVFDGNFEPCPSTAFPAEFRPGASVKVCYVYLVPDQGRMRYVSFRSYKRFDPITWKGKVVAYGSKKRKQDP
ncbi:MAG: hypothetical protein ACRCYQ_05265 [Nocardioides sp.]